MKKGTKRRSRRGTLKPRKPLTIEKLTTLTDSEYFQNNEGVTFSVEDKAMENLITIKDLIAKFYRIQKGLNPIAFKLITENRESIPEKVWIIVMYGNFHLDIYSNKSHSGPHPLRLWFKSFTTKDAHWIASCQIEAFFFNEKEMREAVRQAIIQKSFVTPEHMKNNTIIP